MIDKYPGIEGEGLFIRQTTSAHVITTFNNKYMPPVEGCVRMLHIK